MTAQLDITEQELAIVQGILQSILPNNSRVWVFGSRAKHTTRHNSDLDLAIEASSALNKTTLMQLASAFEDSHLPYTVDLVDLQQVEAYFKDIIDEQKVSFPLWGKVPELRFPEFEGAWKLKRGKDLFLNSRVKGEDGLPIYSVTLNDGLVPRASLDKKMENDAASGDNLRAQAGDLVYNMMRMWQGALGLAHEECMVSPAYVVLSGKAKTDTKFFEYNLKRPRSIYDLWAYSYGLTNDRLRLYSKDFLRIKFCIPEDKVEQQKIASFLTCIDNKLTKLRRKRELLNDYKRGLMKQLFSQAMRFKQDDGSEFPEWKDTVLEKVANVVGGGTPDTFFDDYWGGEIQWFTPSEIKSKYLLSSKRTISDKGLKASSAKLLPKGSLLLSTRATVGDVGIALRESTTNQGFQSLIIKPDNSNEFWYYWLKSNKKALLRKSSGSTFLEIGKREVVKLAVKKPIFSEQQKIADCLSSFDAKIDAVAQQIQQLDTFKKGLLQKMFV
jgi:type I restriction enzyme S subunit